MADKQDYSDLLSGTKLKDYKARFEQLKRTADEFIVKSNFQDTVYCNIRILAQVLLDYLADIERLKEFHKIKKVRSEKIYAYLIAWIVRRKPLQYKADSEVERDIFVNERFATYLMLGEALCCGKDLIDEKHLDEYSEYIKLLLYYFKYQIGDDKAIMHTCWTQAGRIFLKISSAASWKLWSAKFVPTERENITRSTNTKFSRTAWRTGNL